MHIGHPQFASMINQRDGLVCLVKQRTVYTDLVVQLALRRALKDTFTVIEIFGAKKPPINAAISG